MKLQFKIEINNCFECPFKGYSKKGILKCTYEKGFKLEQKFGEDIDPRCKAK